MLKVKIETEGKDQAPAQSAVEQAKAMPKKAAGPQRLLRMPMKSPYSAGGELDHAADRSIGAMGQAQTMRGLQRTLGNTHASRMTGASPSSSPEPIERPMQMKLTVGQPGDMYEREAEVAASQISAGQPVSPVSRLPAGGLFETMSQRPEEQEPVERQQEEEEKAQRRIGVGLSSPNKIDTTMVERAMARSGSGSPLNPTLQTQMEEGFGADFSGVHVHAGTAAHAAAQALDARAFTRGSDIYLARGESSSDSRLVAHELTHVIQQSDTASPAISAQSHRTNSLVQLERGRRRRRAFRQRVYVVRDRGLGLGGGFFVNDLAGFKRHVMRTRNTSTWTLVLAIHGGENRLAAQSPPNWQRNAIFYEAADIDRMFLGDPDWVSWRDTYGPNHLSFVACQVSRDFEMALIHNLTRHAAGTGGQLPAPTQSAQGLGTGCKPLASVPAMSVGVTTRATYRRLIDADRQRMLRQLRQWNSRFGYYGAPPVPGDQVLDYFFEEAPRGSWVNVEVGVRQTDGTLRGTGIAFWNRSTGPDAVRFRQNCSQGVGGLSPHRPSAPPPTRNP